MGRARRNATRELGHIGVAPSGLEHLLARTIDTPQAPEVSFRDDPLRMLRAARFEAQLGFHVADRVRAAMADAAATILNISAERVRDELVKLLSTPDPTGGLRLLTDSGILDHVLPEDWRGTQLDSLSATGPVSSG